MRGKERGGFPTFAMGICSLTSIHTPAGIRFLINPSPSRYHVITVHIIWTLFVRCIGLHFFFLRH